MTKRKVMTSLNMLDAVSAYNKTSSLDGKGFGVSQAPSSDFTSLVEKALSDTKDKLDIAETSTAGSVKGDISLEDLAIAVANAEVSLKTLVSIRDKLVSALQDILRMPI